MLLRNGKRKLDERYNPRRKKTRLSFENKTKLYVNDPNTLIDEFMQLRGLEDAKCFQLEAVKLMAPYKSEQDMIRRVNEINKEIDMDQGNIQCIFKTRYAEKVEKIYDILLNIKSLEDQAPDTLKCIAEMAVVDMKSCDNPMCDENVIFLEGNKVRTTEEASGWITRHNFMYYEPGSDKKYYHLKSKASGEVMYCYKCAGKYVVGV